MVEVPGGLQFTGWQRVRHDLGTKTKTKKQVIPLPACAASNR